MYTLYNSSLNHFTPPLVTKTTKPKKVTDKTSVTILYIYHDTFLYLFPFCFIQFRRERSFSERTAIHCVSMVSGWPRHHRSKLLHRGRW